MRKSTGLAHVSAARLSRSFSPNLIQVGLVAATRPLYVAVIAGTKIIDFSGQASFTTSSIDLNNSFKLIQGFNGYFHGANGSECC